MINRSCIYTGKVIHKRFKPKKHFFQYKVFSLFLDLDEIKEISNKINLFSYNKFNLISFFDIDHGPRDGSSIEDWVKQNLECIGISNKQVKITFFITLFSSILKKGFKVRKTFLVIFKF